MTPTKESIGSISSTDLPSGIHEIKPSHPGDGGPVWMQAPVKDFDSRAAQFDRSLHSIRWK